VARILVVEPHADVQTLVELVIERLGHEALLPDAGAPDDVDVDAAVIEPGGGIGLEWARRLRARKVPVVFTSIYPASRELLELAPVAYLVKPFALYALERAVGDALRATAAPV